ncbi:DUF3624 family protein [Emticicia sp. ODNR4P]|nr:DUF3624 family protein [Emticicia sp. ODNR4P]
MGRKKECLKQTLFMELISWPIWQFEQL